MFSQYTFCNHRQLKWVDTSLVRNYGLPDNIFLNYFIYMKYFIVSVFLVLTDNTE